MLVKRVVVCVGNPSLALITRQNTNSYVVLKCSCLMAPGYPRLLLFGGQKEGAGFEEELVCEPSFTKEADVLF